MIKIKCGLDLPLAGRPKQSIEKGPSARSVALLGVDYIGLKPTMLVQVGDRVRTGQALFIDKKLSDKKNPDVQYTAPATGTVSAIHRGDKRVLLSVVINVQADDPITFPCYDDLSTLTREQLVDVLVQSGLWTALRTRPFSCIPKTDTTPHSLFVTAMDTRPLAADPAVVIARDPHAFANGLTALSLLTERLFVCKAADSGIPAQAVPRELQGLHVETFVGPHPAGLAGTHIHALDPVSANKTVWVIDYQDVMAVGQLLKTGHLPTERVISLAGPQVQHPRLLTTRLGANLEELTAGELKTGDNRLISGSVLGGRTALGATAYLGRYHQQVSVLKEGRQREFLGWLSLGARKHSALGIYLSQFWPKKRLGMTTNTNGSERAMVPVGTYERVLPLDMLPTHLLRALIVGDTETAQALGCLELDEEDLALCTYVCPGKYEYGPILRDNLSRIEQEG